MAGILQTDRGLFRGCPGTWMEGLVAESDNPGAGWLWILIRVTKLPHGASKDGGPTPSNTAVHSLFKGVPSMGRIGDCPATHCAQRMR